MKKTGAGLVLLVLLCVNLAFILLPRVIPVDLGNSWYKGPLIDPVSPYSTAAGFKLLGLCAAAILDLGVIYSYIVFSVFRRPKTKLRRALIMPLLILAVAGSFLTVEAGLRVYLLHHMVTMFMPDPELNWKLTPNLKEFFNKTGGEYLSTNSLGWRAPEPPAPKGENEFRVMVMGDSSNYGLGVSEKDTWAKVLEGFLAKAMPDRKVTVYNASCPGHTTHQALKLIARYRSRIKPDLVVVGYNNDPALEYYSDKEREEKSLFLKKLKILLYKSRFYIIFRQVIIGARHGYNLNWESPDEQNRKSVDGRRMVHRVPLEEYRDNLKALMALSDRDRFSLVVLRMPVNFSVTHFIPRFYDERYPATLLKLREHGMQLVDVDKKWKSEGIQDFLPGHIFHPDAGGHNGIARMVFEKLTEMGIAGRIDNEGEGAPGVKELAPINIGYSRITPLHTMIGEILKRTDILKENGFAGNFQSFLRGNDQANAGDFMDATFTCEVPAIEFLGDDESWVIIGQTGCLGSIGLLAGSNSGIEKVADIKGRKVGAPLGSTAHMDLLRWSKKAKLEPGKDYELIDMGMKDHENALEKGEVDLVATWDPWLSRIKTKSDASVIAERPFYSLIIMKRSFATSHPQFLQKYIDAIAQALTFARNNRSEVTQWVASASGIDRDALDAVLEKSGRMGADVPDLGVSDRAVSELSFCYAFITNPEKNFTDAPAKNDPAWIAFQERFFYKSPKP